MSSRDDSGCYFVEDTKEGQSVGSCWLPFIMHDAFLLQFIGTLYFHNHHPERMWSAHGNSSPPPSSSSAISALKLANAKQPLIGSS
jgi:hypothetical protein